MTDFADQPMEFGGHGRMGFTSIGGGIHHTAVLGQAPESRSHQLGHQAHPVLVHPTARIEAFVTVDAGTFRNTSIGARSWLMKRVHVGHDAVIGEDCELTPGVIVGGEVTIGDRVQVKLGAILRPQITVGDDALIGMGAVVLTDVPAGAVVVGNPARFLRYRDGHEASEATAVRDAKASEPLPEEAGARYERQPGAAGWQKDVSPPDRAARPIGLPPRRA